jgi:hypothetical protein
MGEVGAERAGMLILRAWTEACRDGNLRVRVVSVIGSDEQTLGVVANVDEVWAIIRPWIENILGPSHADEN